MILEKKKDINKNPQKENKFIILMLSLATISIFFSAIMIAFFGDKMLGITSENSINVIMSFVNGIIVITLIIVGLITSYLTFFSIKKYRNLR